MQSVNESGKFQKKLGYWTLTATSLGGVIGSGWLLGAQYAAQTAGPASIISWIIGGFAVVLVALVFVELAIARPESGGLVRWPRYTNGIMVASIIGWAMWLAYAANPPTEASGMVQYVSKFFPGALYNGTQLTALGIIIALLLMAIFVLVNYFGVHIFARANLVVTLLKFIVPTLTLLTLILSGLHPGNYVQYGGFAPYGIAPALSAIATSGVIFAYTGFRAAIDMSGEVVNPKRDILRSVISALVISIVIYLCLEIVFLGAVPGASLTRIGWHGINFSSPYVQLATNINAIWLVWLLIADSIVSPAGSSFVYTASNSRIVYGLAQNRFFPRFLGYIHNAFGVPTRALLLNFVVGLLFLVPLKSWHDIISVTSALGVFTYATGAVSVMVFRRMRISTPEHQVRGISWIAPLAFIVSSLIIYWAGWTRLESTILMLALGIVAYAISFFVNKSDTREVTSGIWIIVYIAFLLVMSYLGSFKGIDAIPAPWDSLIVAAASLAVYWWAVRAGVSYMSNSEPLPSLPAESEALPAAGIGD